MFAVLPTRKRPYRRVHETRLPERIKLNRITLGCCCCCCWLLLSSSYWLLRRVLAAGEIPSWRNPKLGPTAAAAPTMAA